jgi:hypothetical protein
MDRHQLDSRAGVSGDNLIQDLVYRRRDFYPVPIGIHKSRRPLSVMMQILL